MIKFTFEDVVEGQYCTEEPFEVGGEQWLGVATYVLGTWRWGNINAYVFRRVSDGKLFQFDCNEHQQRDFCHWENGDVVEGYEVEEVLTPSYRKVT